MISVDSRHKNVDFKNRQHRKKAVFTGVTERNVKNVDFTPYYKSSRNIKRVSIIYIYIGKLQVNTQHVAGLL